MADTDVNGLQVQLLENTTAAKDNCQLGALRSAPFSSAAGTLPLLRAGTTNGSALRFRTLGFGNTADTGRVNHKTGVSAHLTRALQRAVTAGSGHYCVDLLLTCDVQNMPVCAWSLFFVKWPEKGF